MTVLAVVIIALLTFAIILLFSGVLPYKLRSGSDDTGNTLRYLLLARAEGKLSQAEFEQQQTKLYDALLQPSAVLPSLRLKILLLALPAVIAFAVATIYLLQHAPKDAEIITTPLGTKQHADAMPAEKLPANTPGGDLSVMVKRLADKMAQNPTDGQGWLLLARTYGELRRHDDAAKAYSKAAKLLPADASLLADWADAYVIAHDRKWDSEARDIVKRALAVDPKHLKSLSLSGSEAFARADYKTAIDFWTRMKNVASADSIEAKMAETNIKEAAAKLSNK